MPKKWTADIIASMHLHRITARDLAQHMNLRPEYLSMILNGHREPAHAQERFTKALDELIAKRK